MASRSYTRLMPSLAAAVAVPILCVNAGRHQSSLMLICLFVAWSASPFLGLMLIARASWLARAVAFSCLIVYALVNLDILHMKLGFTYLVVPLISWIAIGVDRAISRNSLRQ